MSAIGRNQPARRAPRRFAAVFSAAIALAAVAAPARAEWMQPDATYRDAQMLARSAARDTAGHAGDVGRLDTLAVALLRLGRTSEAAALCERVLSLSPDDPAAHAALGKLALFANRLDEAEKHLVPARSVEGVTADLYYARLRRADWLAAAKRAEEVGETGAIELYMHLASPELTADEQVPDGPGAPVFTILAGPPKGTASFQRTWPVPLVKVKLNGQSVVMAVDVGLADCLIDASAARLAKVRTLTSQRTVLWNGNRAAVSNAWVRDLEIGGYRIATVPAGVLSLRRYSLLVNPQAPSIAGVIGVNLLRRFNVAFDWKRGLLEIARPDVPLAVAAGAASVPFEWWGESELMVHGTVNGGRRMSLMLSTGLPGGVGAPQEVFDEVGIRPGSMAKALRSAGSVLQGHPWAQAGVPVATVGALAANKLTGWSGAFDSLELWRHGVRRDGVIGPEMWRGRRVVFDWAKSELMVESGAP